MLLNKHWRCKSMLFIAQVVTKGPAHSRVFPSKMLQQTPEYTTTLRWIYLVGINIEEVPMCYKRMGLNHRKFPHKLVRTKNTKIFRSDDRWYGDRIYYDDPCKVVYWMRNLRFIIAVRTTFSVNIWKNAIKQKYYCGITCIPSLPFKRLSTLRYRTVLLFIIDRMIWLACFRSF